MVNLEKNLLQMSNRLMKAGSIYLRLGPWCDGGLGRIEWPMEVNRVILLIHGVDSGQTDFRLQYTVVLV